MDWQKNDHPSQGRAQAVTDEALAVRESPRYDHPCPECQARVRRQEAERQAVSPQQTMLTFDTVADTPAQPEASPELPAAGWIGFRGMP